MAQNMAKPMAENKMRSKTSVLVLLCSLACSGRQLDFGLGGSLSVDGRKQVGEAGTGRCRQRQSSCSLA